ncbi:OLC1v1034702C1 [Oldenlandia corymbosa var. corymbosa]|uniref:OLC1v1034702C1 n=1 Tax=Oldenlandia corymbosa var. corymbosa TaxID=529605 RepID=A0AAV1CU25_OLDCO|nr:OLC1v1034702C1 [Oldenlandia corymbosa var. corymbosa]
MRTKHFSGNRPSHYQMYEELDDDDAAYLLMDLSKAQGSFNFVRRESDATSSSDSSCGFDAGFSIILFLSAIRFVLTTPVSSPNEEEAAAGNSSVGSYDHQGECAQRRFPCYTTQEIVERVRLSPGDARVLELSLRLEDLVRGVLRIFSSKLAPKGVHSWKPLTMYDRCSKTWSWIGPIPSPDQAPKSTDHHDLLTSTVSPGAWGLKGQVVKKLVNSFSAWLKESLDMLQEFSRLPPPPLQLMQPARDLKRFNRAKSLKISVSTLNPISKEVRDYFRKEEALRYTIPERPFAYTALDGRKASVAPFRRRSGKPSRKARDHFILKSDRPPCFTVLSLVRDAVARLPDGVGTRADVCILVRDSGYIIDGVSDDQVEQVVSGALDRLHYERDACVKFDRNHRLWIYLHGSREEEDFEDDGTSSKKIRKKIKYSKRQQIMSHTFSKRAAQKSLYHFSPAFYFAQASKQFSVLSQHSVKANPRKPNTLVKSQRILDIVAPKLNNSDHRKAHLRLIDDFLQTNHLPLPNPQISDGVKSQSDPNQSSLSALFRLHRQGLTICSSLLSNALSLCGSDRDVRIGIQIHGLAVNYGFFYNVYVGSSLVSFYSKCGELSSASKVFEEMPERNVITWTAIISAFAQDGQLDTCFQLYRRMRNSTLVPNAFTFSSFLSACTDSGYLGQGRTVHGHTATKAVELFEQMKRKGMKPDAITFLGLMTSSRHAGFVDTGQCYFQAMVKYGVEPDLDHYACIVDLLGRAGRLEEARDFIRRMPISPNAVIWGSLLSSCRLHGNVWVGIEAAENRLELEPSCAATHVQLANLYANVGYWDQAARVRKLMKDNGLKTDPGCSWIEIKNEIFQFRVEDRTSPSFAEIMTMLDCVVDHIRGLDHSLDIYQATDYHP